MNEEEIKNWLNPPKEKNVHYIWHSFMDYMKKWYYNLVPGFSIKTMKSTKRKYKCFDVSKMVGYKAMCRIAKYAKNKENIFITSCDDSWHMGSDIVLITHECEDRFMGTTMIFVPQCKTDINQVFLYPHHVDDLIKCLQEIKKRNETKVKD